VTFADAAPQLRVGSFVRSLPPLPTGVARFTMTLLGLAMQVDPSWLDRPPVCETAFGELPVLMVERCQALEDLVAHTDGRSGDDGRLVQAAQLLDPHLRVVEEAWEVKRRAIWSQLREAEGTAAELLGVYLAHNLVLARRERERYFYPDNGPPRATSDDYRSLVRAIRVVASARRAADVDAVRREQNVVTAVTMAATAIAVLDAWANRGAFQLDRRAWQIIDAAAQLTTEAAQHRAEAMTAYLRVLRREARAHPVLLVLDHERLVGSTVLDVGRLVDTALRDAETALGRLRVASVNTAAVPAQRRAQDLTPTGLAERLSTADPVSVWKLPFFVEAALLEMPPTQAVEVRRVMELAARTGEAQSVYHGLALLGINSAAMLAPAAGSIGVALALAWGLFNLGTSVREYRQLSDLFHATLDPAVLLRGLDHEEASRLTIILDIFGLLVW